MISQSMQQIWTDLQRDGPNHLGQGKPVLHGIDLALARGQLCCIVGAVGAGTAVGETVILLTPPCVSRLRRLIKAEGGAAE